MSIDKIFEALSSAPRRRILAYLSKADMTAGEIAQRFADVMSQPAISKHLSVLENAGLVWREKRGQNMHYGLKEDILTHTLAGFLGEVCVRAPGRSGKKARRRRKGGRSPARRSGKSGWISRRQAYARLQRTASVKRRRYFPLPVGEGSARSVAGEGASHR